LDSFDSKDMIVYECGTDICDRFYAKHGYYHGKNWTLGVLHSYQGDDQLHGDIDGIISKTKEAVEDPDRGNLRGFFNIPETAGHNIMYWQLVTQLAWEPSDITRDGFIVDYCLRRYGAASAPVMEKSIRALVEAVYSGGDWQMAYKRLGCKYGPIDWWPIVDDFEGSVSEYLCKEARIAVGLKKSLDIALTQVKNQSGNPLYENDLIDVAKCYWGHNSNFYIRKAYEAFAESDQREFERNVALSVDMLDRIERLLSTREDYHLQPQIVEVEAYHGSNPHSAFMMKRACVNEQYPNNDVYELFHFYYIPRVKAWAEIVRARMLEEENTVSSRDVMPRWREIEDSWAANPIAVPDDRRLKVTPVQAVLVLYGDEAEDKAILNACAR
jgi:alpha-N-acetylglucosaminidase